MKLLNRLQKSRFLKSAGILASGSVISQAIVAGCSFILTRLYAPEDLAVYAYVLSIINTFQITINAFYNTAVVVEEDEANVYALIKLSVIIGFIFTLLITIGCVIFFLNSATLKGYLPFVIIVFLNLLAFVFIQVSVSYNNRMREYKVMSSVMVIRAAIQNFGAVLLGFLPSGPWGLLAPYTVGQFAGLSRQTVTLRQHLDEIYRVSKADMLRMAKKHYKQPLYALPSGFINSYSLSSITFFIESLYGLAELGFYAVSVRLLGLPMNIISQNVGAILLVEAAEEYNRTGAFRKSYKKSLLMLSAMALPFMLIMLLLGPAASGFVFGAGWERAGIYIQLLAPMYAFRFVGTAITRVFTVGGKQNVLLIMNIFLLMATLLSFGAAKMLGLNAEKFIILISVSKSIVYTVIIIIAGVFSRGTGKINV